MKGGRSVCDFEQSLCEFQVFFANAGKSTHAGKYRSLRAS